MVYSVSLPHLFAFFQTSWLLVCIRNRCMLVQRSSENSMQKCQKQIGIPQHSGKYILNLTPHSFSLLSPSPSLSFTQIMHLPSPLFTHSISFNLSLSLFFFQYIFSFARTYSLSPFLLLSLFLSFFLLFYSFVIISFNFPGSFIHFFHCFIHLFTFCLLIFPKLLLFFRYILLLTVPLTLVHYLSIFAAFLYDSCFTPTLFFLTILSFILPVTLSPYLFH